MSGKASNDGTVGRLVEEQSGGQCGGGGERWRRTGLERRAGEGRERIGAAVLVGIGGDAGEWEVCGRGRRRWRTARTSGGG